MDIQALIDSMTQQAAHLHAEYRAQLDEIERGFLKERAQLVSAATAVRVAAWVGHGPAIVRGRLGLRRLRA